MSLLLLTLLSVAALCQGAAAAPPNVVFILADDLGVTNHPSANQTDIA